MDNKNLFIIAIVAVVAIVGIVTMINNAAPRSASGDIVGQATTKTTVLPGGLIIQTVPDGAEVYIDDSYKGVTPLTVYDLSDGNHPISIKRTGYMDYLAFISTKEEKTATLSINLVKT